MQRNQCFKNKYIKAIPTDEKTFLFSLESNGRIKEGMMKFENVDGFGLTFFPLKDYQKILFGVGGGSEFAICVKEFKFESYCFQFEKHFDYHGYKQVLCGEKNFDPKHFFVIQMQQSKKIIRTKK